MAELMVEQTVAQMAASSVASWVLESVELSAMYLAFQKVGMTVVCSAPYWVAKMDYPTASKMVLKTAADLVASLAPLWDATMAEHSARYKVGMMAACLAE
jgi:hypothetical protein